MQIFALFLGFDYCLSHISVDIFFAQKEFASRTGISYTMLNEILNSKRPVTSEIALVIEAALGINPELLINMQSRYNMAQARMKPAIESNLAHIRKVCASHGSEGQVL